MDDVWARNQHIVDRVIKDYANDEYVEVEIDPDIMNDVVTELENDV